MKKLMIAAAIVCAAAMSQAAQYTWDASDICTGWGAGGSNENNAKGTAYLFLNSGDTTLALVTAAVADGEFLSGGWDKLALDNTAFDGLIATPKTSEDGLAGATGDSFFAVFVADSWTEFEGEGSGTVDPAMAFVGSSKTPGEVKTIGPTQLAFGSQYDASSASGNWYAQAVPEPTSGLLLLLGVAGLALRRRRA